MERSEIQEKLDSIKDLPTLPAIAVEINSLLQAPDSTVETIAENIEKDQAIAAKVLKLINSAFFGVRSKVTNIHDAIVLLGFNSIKNIVLSVSVMKAFSKSDGEETFNISEFWKHSIAVAMTSKKLSQMSGLSNPEDSFTGGLLHDIGKVIMAQYFTDIFIQTIKDIEDNSRPFSIAEQKYLQNMGHAWMGAFLTKKWKFPQSLTLAINNHHSESDSFSELGTIVHCADIIVNIQSINSSPLSIEKKKSQMPVFNKDATKKMIDLITTSREWYPALAGSIAEACSFFIEHSD